MSLITKIPGITFSDVTLPRLYRDSIINPGSKFCFDFLDPFCNPNSDGAIAQGATFTDLVDPTKKAVITGEGGFLNLTGKQGISCAGTDGSRRLALGTNGLYDLSTTNDEFIVIAWIKTPTVGYNPTAYTPFFIYTLSNNNDSQFVMDMGNDGKTPRFSVGAGGSAPEVKLASGFGLGAVTQIAGHWKSTGLTEIFANGALVASSMIGPATLQSKTTTTPKLAGQYIGTVYRLYQEDLVVSGKTAAAQIAADYAANAARFV